MGYEDRREFRRTAGAHWLNLLATVGFVRGPDPVERMWDAARLSEWLRLELGTAPDMPVGHEDLAYVHRFRESLRALAYATIEGAEPDPADVAVADDALSAYEPPRLYVADGRLRRTRPTSVRQAMGWLARHAVTTLIEGDKKTLRICAEPDCGSIFLDPGGRRRWCPNGSCGVKARVRAHRERQATGTSGGEDQG